MISPRSIPLKYTGWKNQHSQVSSKPGRCLHVTEETVRYFDSNKWLWLVMTAVKRSGTTEEYSAFVIRKDSEGVFFIYFTSKRRERDCFMSGILMMIIAIVVLGGAYLLYGRYLQNNMGTLTLMPTPGI